MYSVLVAFETKPLQVTENPAEYSRTLWQSDSCSQQPAPFTPMLKPE